MKTITKPRTIKKLMEFFECNDAMALRLQALYQIGLNHGKMGMFQEGNFSDFADWRNGIGHDIQTLETTLNISDSSVFDIYDEGHDAGLQIFVMGGDNNNGQE